MLLALTDKVYKIIVIVFFIVKNCEFTIYSNGAISSRPPTRLRQAPTGRWAQVSRRSRNEGQMAIDALAAGQ